MITEATGQKGKGTAVNTMMALLVDFLLSTQAAFLTVTCSGRHTPTNPSGQPFFSVWFEIV